MRRTTWIAGLLSTLITAGCGTTASGGVAAEVASSADKAADTHGAAPDVGCEGQEPLGPLGLP